MKIALLIITNLIIGLVVTTVFIVLDEAIGVPKCIVTYFNWCDRLSKKIKRMLR